MGAQSGLWTLHDLPDFHAIALPIPVGKSPASLTGPFVDGSTNPCLFLLGIVCSLLKVLSQMFTHVDAFTPLPTAMGFTFCYHRFVRAQSFYA